MEIHVVDSHTGGEPTRVVIDGGPVLRGPLADRVTELRHRHDTFRSTVVNEPRGSDVLVGALLTPPVDPACAAGVIFFNNVGYLGMCGHGTIGVIVTLAWLGRLGPGEHRIETPVGIVTTTLHDANTVAVRNVPAYRHARGVRVEIEGHGWVSGDVAWGGNWFFLCEDHGQRLALPRTAALGEFCERIRRADRSHRTVRRHLQFRVVPRRRLGSLALRHRHERETGVPRGRGPPRAGRGVAAAQHHGQRVRSTLRTRGGQHCSDDHRPGLGDCGIHAGRRPGRSVRARYPGSAVSAWVPR